LAISVEQGRHGLPTIQGAVYLADASNDHGLAFLGSADRAHRRPSRFVSERG
jgi:hypothetical protein